MRDKIIFIPPLHVDVVIIENYLIKTTTTRVCSVIFNPFKLPDGYFSLHTLKMI